MNKSKENPWKFPVSTRGILIPTASTETCFGATPSFLFRGTGGSFLGWSDRGAKVTTHIHPLPTFRMSGAILVSSFPHMSSWYVQGLCLYLLHFAFTCYPQICYESLHALYGRRHFCFSFLTRPLPMCPW